MQHNYPAVVEHLKILSYCPRGIKIELFTLFSQWAHLIRYFSPPSPNHSACAMMMIMRVVLVYHILLIQINKLLVRALFHIIFPSTERLASLCFFPENIIEFFSIYYLIFKI